MLDLQLCTLYIIMIVIIKEHYVLMYRPRRSEGYYVNTNNLGQRL